MIAKIKNEDGTWNYFEADSITQAVTELKLDEIRKIKNSDIIYMVSDRPDLEGTCGEYLSLTFYKNQQTAQCVITNHACYLMNDVGKTIDKLF